MHKGIGVKQLKRRNFGMVTEQKLNIEREYEESRKERKLGGSIKVEVTWKEEYMEKVNEAKGTETKSVSENKRRWECIGT